MTTILYLPLDERFATRDNFINLSRMTPYQVLTPPLEFLSAGKKGADLNKIYQWIDNNSAYTDSIFLSLEMYLYGGLTNSRISYDSEIELRNRLNQLREYCIEHPDIKIYLSTVIMRIPAYNGNQEEPNYWAKYGEDIYKFSFFDHKYRIHNRERDAQELKKLKEKIPAKYLEEFIWRRNRNHNLTCQLLKYQKQNNLFTKIFLTLDDNAKYGFNKEEETKLKEIVNKFSLQDKVFIYPGADEVALTMLANYAIKQEKHAIEFKTIYRYPKARENIPAYEGQALEVTVRQQIEAAGGQLSTENDQEDIIFLINNSNQKRQKEAMDQPYQVIDNFNLFENTLKNNKIIALADVFYANGGDYNFINWLIKQKLSINYFCYSGWNTAGNTLGTVIASTILLNLFNYNKENVYLNTLRLLEDYCYQSLIRKELKEFLKHTAKSSLKTSFIDNEEYLQKIVRKRLSYELNLLNKVWEIPYKIKRVYFPWNRLFEMGIELEKNNDAYPLDNE